jgi:hypothetical protein
MPFFNGKRWVTIFYIEAYCQLWAKEKSMKGMSHEYQEYAMIQCPKTEKKPDILFISQKGLFLRSDCFPNSNLNGK